MVALMKHIQQTRACLNRSGVKTVYLGGYTKKDIARYHEQTSGLLPVSKIEFTLTIMISRPILT
jgi:hypothetical protein